MRSFTESVLFESIFVCAWACACVCLSFYVSSEEDVCVLVLEKKVRRVSCCGELCRGIGALADLYS